MLTDEEIEERFEELVKNAPNDDFGNTIRMMAKKGLSVGQKEYLIDKGGSSDLSVTKIYNLVARFYLNTKDILESKSSHASGEMFLVQLWLIIDEVLAYFKEQSSSVSNFKGFYGIDDAFIDCTKKSYQSISSLKSLLSTEEVAMLEFLRIESCHLRSSKYHIQWNKKSKTFVKDLNGIYRAEIRQIIKSELEKYNGSIDKVSEHFANKVYSQLEVVFECISDWKRKNE